jgi:hypothetical protein
MSVNAFSRAHQSHPDYMIMKEENLLVRAEIAELLLQNMNVFGEFPVIRIAHLASQVDSHTHNGANGRVHSLAVTARGENGDTFAFM